MVSFLQQQDGIIDFDIIINGKKIKDTVEVQEIIIDAEANRITTATIVVQDGGAIGVVSEPFEHSEGKDFIPGGEIEIALGYLDNTATVFKGLIISQRLIVRSGKSQLMVQCSDKAINMTKGRFNAIFQNKTDTDALKGIVSKYGLDMSIDSTTFQHKALVQYNCSDWDYLVTRAEANNMMVYTHQNKLYVKQLDFGKNAEYEIRASQVVVDIDLSLESDHISSNYTMSSWNPDSQEVTSSTVKIQDTLGQGNMTAKKLSNTLTNADGAYVSAALEADEMKAYLNALANKAVLEKIQGKITLPGTTKIVAGDLIKLSEFSARFNGKAYVSRVVHNLQDGEWLTELHIGKGNERHAEIPNLEALGASGLIPAIRGTQIAKVKKIHEDPDNNFRVLVTLPTLKGEGQQEGLWARIAFPYASGDAGYFFFPEVGDEVLLTFMGDDPRYPVIFGSLYSKKNKAKETPDEKNQFKSIYSKSGISIRFDDEEKILTLETPEKNMVVLDDKSKSIRLEDMNKNSIVMNDSGITLKSSKDITLKADGNVTIDATSKLAMKAKSDVTVDGLSIANSAKTSFTAKGNASAELSASGQTTVKGAMVMIN